MKSLSYEGHTYRSLAECNFAAILKEWKVPYQHDYKFCPPRRFMLDFAIIAPRVGIEIEGITAKGGRHQRFMGYMKDCEKYNLALSLGWKIYRIPSVWLTDKKFSQYYLDFVTQLKNALD